MSSAEMLCSLAYLGLLLLSGYAVVVWLGRELSGLEMFGLSACLGPAVVGFCLFGLSMMGHVPTGGVLVSLAVIAAGSVAGSLIVRGRKFMARERGSVWWSVATLAIVVYGAVFVAREAFFVPAVAWDAFNAWQLKAKVLAHEPMIPRPDYFFNPNLSYSHLRYPILVPMISAGAMAAAGERDGIGKPPSVLLFVGMGVLMFAAMRRVQGGFIAAVTAAIFVTALPVINDSGTGTAELALTAFYAGSLICVLRWLERMEVRDLILCALFSGAMAWTKNEGLAMAVINAIVVLVFTPLPLARRYLFATIWFVLIVGAIYLPWAVYSHDFPRTDEDYASRFTPALMLGGLHRLPQIFRGFFDEMSSVRKWGGLWAVLMLTAILGIGKPTARAIAGLWAALLLQIGVLTLAYMVSVFTPEMLLPLSIERLVLHMTPAAAMLIAYQWQSFSQMMPMSASVTSGR